MADCGNCYTTKAAFVRVVVQSNGTRYEYCDVCSNARSTGIPDIYLGGKGGVQTCENICDPKSGKPIPFSSKREKKAIMDRLKLIQHPSAERQHGYRNEKYLHPKTYG